MRICRLCQTTNPDTTAFCPVCGAALPAWNEDAGARLVDRVIGGNFRLVECIGEGAMGRVFRAEQLSLGRTVAVKLLHPRLQDDEAFRERFSAEARAASCLNHANSVAVIDFGYADGGEPYIAMEYLRGRSLTDVVGDDFPMRPSRIAALIGQIASALEEAHALGVVHCDLKPDNIIVEALRDGREHVKVLDFGLARLQAAQLDAHSRRASGPGSTMPLGAAGGSGAVKAALLGQENESEVMGTPRYLSPERLRGKPSATPQDIYALGVILYEMLCGAPPFSGSVSQVVASHLSDMPIPPRMRQPELGIPESLEAISLSCLSKDPTTRPTAVQLKSELEGFVVARTPGGRVIPCGECAAPNRADARFCSECGAPGARARSGPGAIVKTPGAMLALEGTFEEEVHTGVAAVPNAFGKTLDPLPLVGRDQELDALEGMLLLGGPEVRFVLVTGEAGVGKTRLTREFLPRAHEFEWKVLTAEADPAPTARTLLPAMGLASAILQVPVPRNAEELERVAGALKHGDRLMVGLRELFNLPGVAVDLERTVRQRELRAAFRAIVDGAEGGSPLLLICEDVDRWDRPSQSLLADLAARPQVNRPLAIIMTTRAKELAGFPQRISRIPVPLLSPHQTNQLAAADAERRGLPLDSILRQLGPAPLGLPLHIEQLGWCCHEGLTEDGPGATLPDLVTKRLRDVPPAARRVLQHLVAAGMEMDLELLSACMEADGIRGGVGYLVDHGWLTHDIEPGSERLLISHRLLQEVAYGTIPRGSLGETHGRLAAALMGRAAPLDLVAHHAYQAGEARKAVEGLVAAGHEAERRLDDQGATLWFKRAHDAARRAMLSLEGEDDEPRFAAASLKLAQALRFEGELPVAQAIAEEALALEVDVVTRIGLHRVLAGIASARGGNAKARTELEKAAALVERVGALGGGRGARVDPRTKVRPSGNLASDSYTELAATFVAEGRQAEAISVLERGQEIAAQLSGAGRAPWRLVCRLAELHACAQARPEALQAFVAALDAAREADSKVGLARVGAMMAGFLEASGDAGGAEAARGDAAAALLGVGDHAALELLQSGQEMRIAPLRRSQP